MHAQTTIQRQRNSSMLSMYCCTADALHALDPGYHEDEFTAMLSITESASRD